MTPRAASRPADPRADRRASPRPPRPSRRSGPAPRSTVSPTSADRFAARARARRWLALRPVLVLWLVVALLSGAAWLVLGSGVLALHQVTVTGTSRLSADQVVAAAGAPVGRPLARVDTGAIAARVARLRPVAAVEVRRAWPHTLRVIVTERLAAGVVQAGGQFLLVDRTGVAFATTSRRPVALPVVEAGGEGGDGGRREEAIAAALDVLGALPADLSTRVMAARAETPEAVTLRLRGGVTVVWGAPTDLPLKATVLHALVRQRAKVYDVSAPEAPVVRG